jgi:hypothetical protein
MNELGLKPLDLLITEQNEDSLKQTLAIAYYNLGTEQEHINEYLKARVSYGTALRYSKESANSEKLQLQVNESLGAVLVKIQAQQKFGLERSQKREVSKTSNFFNNKKHIQSMTSQKTRILGVPAKTVFESKRHSKQRSQISPFEQAS